MDNVPALAARAQALRPEAARAPLEEGCHFPAPLPHRVYCQPAAFHRVNGQEYHTLTVAYGASRPLDRRF